MPIESANKATIPMQNGRQTHAGQKRQTPSEDTAIVMDRTEADHSDTTPTPALQGMQDLQSRPFCS
jgi:hypothetical protein